MVPIWQRVEEIKNKRQAHFIFQRMKAAKKIQKAKDIRQVFTIFFTDLGLTKILVPPYLFSPVFRIWMDPHSFRPLDLDPQSICGSDEFSTVKLGIFYEKI